MGASNQRTVACPRDTAPFPSRQLFILALCRICEPIAFMSIFPYIYYMVASFQITNDDRQIAMYAAMVTSAFAFAEFSTGVFWGRLSDKVGRKPILLTGMAGTGLSMLIFGFAPSFPVALLARALGGLLNGNIGVLQTTVAEVVTVDSHKPRAYSIMPFVWCLGSIIGSGLGGTLAQPVKSYPTVFAPGTLFDRYPYLLPNLVCTAVVIFGLVVGILFLEETHEDKKHRRDYGLELGQCILNRFRKPNPGETISAKIGYFEETLSFLTEDDQPPDYRSTESSPRLLCSPAPASEPPPETLDTSHAPVRSQLSVRSMFSRQVVLNVIGYGILAFHTISFEQLLSVLFSMPQSHEPVSLPFKFTGGFGFPTKTIGFVLSSQGFLQMIVQIFVFPVISRKFGSLKTFRGVILAYPFLYFLVPYLPLLPKTFRMPGVYVVLLWKVTAQSLAYPSLAMMLANLSPSKKVLGTLNGVAASSASLSRAIGPTVSGFVHTAGLHLGYSGLSWWSCSLVALVGALLSSWMNETPKQEKDEVEDEESILPEPLISPAAVEPSLALLGGQHESNTEPTLVPDSTPLKAG